MHKLVSLLFSLCLVMAAGSSAVAQDRYANDPQPSKGIGGIVVGWVATANAVASFAVIPLCYASWYPGEASDVCSIAQGTVGVLALTAGVVGLTIGYRRHARYKEWKARNMVGLDQFRLAPSRHGGQLQYRLRF